LAIIVDKIDLNENNMSLKIYPNPVSNELIIEMEGNIEIKKFEILNSVGQSLFNCDIKHGAITCQGFFNRPVFN
jgi:hypothetical protein